MKSVLILDANQRSALAVTRSLGAKGVPIFTADETASSLAGSSRYSELYVTHPSALDQSHVFISFIADLCKQHEIKIILPMTELTTTLLLQHKNRIPGIILPFPERETIDSLADKCNLMALAELLQIPFPETVQVPAGIHTTIDPYKLEYPLVLKPGMSWIENKNQWLHTAVRFAENANIAEHILHTDPAFGSHAFMLQECVSGHGEGVFALYDKGRAIAFFAHRRLREKPPRGGVSVLSEAIDVSPRLQAYAMKILEHVQWHGVAMVEFKVDDDGNAYLMEVNTRFWGSLQLAIDAGVDFPWLLYQIACGEKPEPIESYKTGKRLRWILGDVDSLYLVLRDKNYSYQEKISAIFSFLTPHPFKTRHEVNRLTDIKPFIWELKKYFQDILK